MHANDTCKKMVLTRGALIKALADCRSADNRRQWWIHEFGMGEVDFPFPLPSPPLLPSEVGPLNPATGKLLQ